MVIAGNPLALSHDMFSKIGQYRQKVFVETLGWNLQTRDGMELDQFDRPDTLYMCLVSCDHIPRRSMALFRAKAVLDELIAGLPPRSSTD